MTLSEQTVLVTGAAGAVGCAVCQHIDKAGGRLIAVDSDITKLDPLTAETILAKGGLVHQLDVADEKAWPDLAGALKPIDGRVTCAAVIDVAASPGEPCRSAWDHTISTTLTGVWLACEAAIFHMLAHGRGGSIVNVGSVVARLGSATSQPAYTSAKGGVLALSRELAVANAAEGIRVNVVSPGLLDTDLTRGLIASDEELGRRLTHIPLGRLGLPGDVAAMVAWLLSAEANYITGADIPIDGGLSAAFVTGREAGQPR